MVWRNIRNMKAVVTWKSGNNLLELFHRVGSGWTCTKYVESGSSLKKLFIRGFKTKSQALSFAKNYMLKH